MIKWISAAFSLNALNCCMISRLCNPRPHNFEEQVTTLTEVEMYNKEDIIN